MKCYWDSSALLNALASRAVIRRLKTGEHVTRSHAYAEVFSHLSGRGLPIKGGGRQRVTAADAAKMVSSLAAKMAVCDLSPEDTLATLNDASSQGVEGARIHDLMHARAAKLSGAEVILTRDSGFSTIAAGMAAEWP
jgi:predicted nucleic acid-binding protein